MMTTKETKDLRKTKRKKEKKTKKKKKQKKKTNNPEIGRTMGVETFQKQREAGY